MKRSFYNAESDEKAMESQHIWDPVDGVENNLKVKKKKKSIQLATRHRGAEINRERAAALHLQGVLLLLLGRMFTTLAYIWWRSTVTHAMAALMLKARALIKRLSVIKPRSTRP